MMGRGVVLSYLRPYLKLVFGKVNLNSCCVPIFQSLASTVGKIGRGSQLFWTLPCTDPRQFRSKTLFSGKLVPDPICVPNLKLLTLTVAKIRRGSQIFLGCSSGPDPRQLWSETLFFGKLVPNPICVPNLKLLASTVAEIRRGPKFLDAPLAKPPSNFGPRRYFWQATPRTQMV